MAFDKFLRIYRWPLVVAVAAVALAHVCFGGAFFRDVASKLTEKDWWVENSLTFLIFTALISWIVTLAQNSREALHRAQFEGWKVVIREKGVPGDAERGIEHTQDLYWQEVERFLDSAFERWKFVKSIASGAYWINLLTIKQAEEGEDAWVVRHHKDRTIIVDLAKGVACGQVTDKRSKETTKPASI